MQHPIQRIHVSSAADRLFTATSNVLHAFSPDGALLYSWIAPVPTLQQRSRVGTPEADDDDNDDDAVPTAAAVEDDSGPQAKKRKVSEEPSEGSAATEKKRKKKKKKKRDDAPVGPDPSIYSNNAIVKLLATADGSHLIVGTNEDKSVRVFSTQEGKLELLSSRALPKRIADLALVDSGRTILAADKHGDVFALPLLGASVEPPEAPNKGLTAEEAEARRQRTEIYNLPYEHTFVLGHVSMLLALLPITIEAERRTYVLTADRDEHIRVSRWPQSYVIECYCLEHEAFVKNLLVLGWDRETLVSGGGDKYLCRWRWRQARCLQKISLVEHVRDVVGEEVQVGGGKYAEKRKEREGDGKVLNIAVNGLWDVPVAKGILVGVEHVPALFYFLAGEDGEISHKSTLRLPGNVLDVAVVGEGKKILVSMDGEKPIGAYELGEGEGSWKEDGDREAQKLIASVAETVKGITVPEPLVNAVRTNVLYTVGPLRKELMETDQRDM